MPLADTDRAKAVPSHVWPEARLLCPISKMRRSRICAAEFPTAVLRERGMQLGQVDGDDVLLVLSDSTPFAIGAHCTHYHGPLADGLVIGDTVRCPWHHACFSLRTGEALRAPALDPVPCWRVEQVGDKTFVREKIAAPAQREAPVVRMPGSAPASVVIVGGGAAGLAAADMLRREGFGGTINLISADDAPPCDRPNLSKDYLAGTAQEDWIPLRAPEYYAERKIDLLLGTRVSSIDVREHRVRLEDGKAGRVRRAAARHRRRSRAPCDTRAPSESQSPLSAHVRRQQGDCRASAAAAQRVVVVGASFIGLEVAASLRTRGIDVACRRAGERAARARPGARSRPFVRELHEEHGVVFHLGQTVSRIDGRRVTLSDSTTVDADFVVLGVGVRPAIALAEGAGLAIDRGIAVDEYLETSAPRRLCRRRRRAVARSALRRADPRRALGRRASARARSRRGTSSAGASASTRCRSSGASITTSRSTMSAMRRNGTPSRSTDRLPRATAR